MSEKNVLSEGEYAREEIRIRLKVLKLELRFGDDVRFRGLSVEERNENADLEHVVEFSCERELHNFSRVFMLLKDFFQMLAH